MNYLIISIASLLLTSAACQNRQSGPNASSGQNPAVFATSQEAVQKAQRDLAAILKANPSLQLGVDSATVQRAKPGKAVRQVLLDFDKLLRPDSIIPLRSLMKAERNSLIPLLIDNRAVTAVEVARQTNGWRVAALGNKGVANDINALQAVDSGANVTLYEVPNLNVQIYGVQRTAGAEEYYANYKGFTLRQAVPLDRLYETLRQDAQAFQRTYGNQLKRKRLVR